MGDIGTFTFISSTYNSEGFKMKAEQFLRDAFLDFVNDYVTVERYAECNNISIEDARVLIELGRKYHEQYVERSRIA